MKETGHARTVLALAAAHLRHEWVLTLCLVAALAAVLSPQLVLLGLKEGTIATLRERLVEDPLYREIRPAATRPYPPGWFRTMEGDPGVAFVLPTILPASSVVYLAAADREQLLDLVPTGPGDPLLLENGGVIPGPAECVLTSEAARLLGVQAGDPVVARATRSRGGRSEAAEAGLTVAAVLPPRAGGLPRVYAPLDLVLDVESYKEGRSVPARGWPGESPRPFLSYRGAVIVTPEPLDPVTRTGLVVNTGLLHVSELDAGQFTAAWGFALPAGHHAYRLSLPTGSVTAASIQAVARKLRGREAILLPDAGPIEITLPDRPEPVRLVGLSLDVTEAAALGLPPLPWGRWDPEGLEPGRITALLDPIEEACPPPGELAAEAAGGCGAGAMTAGLTGASELLFPVTLSPLPQQACPPGSPTACGSAFRPTARPEGRPTWPPLPPRSRGPDSATGAPAKTPPLYLAPAELTGLLRTAQGRRVAFAAAEGGFVLERPGFRGFRLYAKGIDDLPGLVLELREAGIEVIAEVEAIERVRTLDRGLTRLFWLIALLGVCGAGAVLIASLYAAVERERRDLGVLRLIGLARTDVFWFPVFQGLIIALLGVAAGLAGYAALCTLINEVFGQELAPGEAVCRLPAPYLLYALVATLTLAGLSSLAAAWRATRIEPAEAIREE